MADDIRELNALIADYGREFQSPDPRRGPSLGSSRLYADYQPATSSEQAEMLLSFLPGIGEGLDAAHFVKDIQDENYGAAGLSALATALPFLGAATLKKITGKSDDSDIFEALKKEQANYKPKKITLTDDDVVKKPTTQENLKNTINKNTTVQDLDAESSAEAEALFNILYDEFQSAYPNVDVNPEDFKEILKKSIADASNDTVPKLQQSREKAQTKFNRNRTGMERLTPQQRARFVIENAKNADLPSVSISKDGYVVGPDDQPVTLYHMTYAKEPFDEFNPEYGESPFLSTSTTPRGAELGSSYGFKAGRDLDALGARIIPMRARANRIFDFENPNHILEVTDYMRKNRNAVSQADLRSPEFDDLQIDAMLDAMLQGNWNVLEDARVRNAMAAQGFDAFTTIEAGSKNVMLMDPVRQVEPLFDPTKTGMIGKYRRGGSVVERSNKHEPKAI